ncbi:Tigger transposable element-derived protein 6 [Frankliniella fusca]|uniref:Tigger transposable element-derived protein 6 n=1 Tax=Frankliniella fusca TaxID=407009 RepID=A0AAE1HZQ9_9NEOP|nr:Tigger transposable element-derived protein 6 [Frankliniella fusca]
MGGSPNGKQAGSIRERMPVSGKNAYLKESLHNWIVKARSMAVKIPLDGIVGFTASHWWLDRFRKRYNVKFKGVFGERVDEPQETVTNWMNAVLLGLLKGYKMSEVYNEDGLGLSYNLLPDKTMCTAEERNQAQAPGNKQSKARVTVLLGIIADGSHKLTPCYREIRKAKGFPWGEVPAV